jgi:AraC-like DNA-binding protein
METLYQTLGDPQGIFEVYPVMEFTGFPPHKHLFYEIAYFARGKGVLRYNGKDHRIQPPQLHVCPPEIAWHEIDCRGAEVWTSSMAVYPRLLPSPRDKREQAVDGMERVRSPRVALDDLADGAKPLIKLSPPAQSRTEALIDIMCEEWRLRQTGYLLRARACVEELIVLALREREGTESSPVQAVTEARPGEARGISREPRVSNAISLMKNNFHRVMSNEELAGLVGIGEKYFVRLFSREVGISPQRYYLRLRLDAAAYQLVHSRLTIQQISVMFGFTSRSHFQSQFKKQFNSSPGVYRYYRRIAEG